MVVYKYGARPGGKDIKDQMAAGHKYYNTLIEAENARRQIGWGGEFPPAPPHDECQCPKCKTQDPTATPRRQHDGCRCPKCHAHWKDVCKRVMAVPLLDIKPFRASRPDGLFWGTYLLIEQAFAAAWKTTNVWKHVRFRSWRKNGAQAGVQIQLGRADAYFRVVKAPDPRMGCRARDGLGRHTLQIRIGSEGQDPIWCEPIPFEMHRPLTGLVKWVKVRLSYVADREVWSVMFTTEEMPAQRLVSCDTADEKMPAKRLDSCDPVPIASANTNVVALDVSWRKMGDSLRIALAQDRAGVVEELRLGPRWRELAARADRIRAERDRLKNDIIEADPRLSRCKSCRGVARTAFRLRQAGEDLGPALEAWLKRDRHLWQYEDGCRRHSVAHRRDEMRYFLRKLRDRYDEIIIKDSSHKQLKEEHALPQPAQRQGQHGAPGEVIEWVRRLWGRDKVCVVSAKNTTDTCACGHVTEHGAELMVACERCGVEVDRDLQSTRNMLAAHANGAGEKPTARKNTARFAKRHKKTGGP